MTLRKWQYDPSFSATLCCRRRQQTFLLNLFFALPRDCTLHTSQRASASKSSRSKRLPSERQPSTLRPRLATREILRRAQCAVHIWQDEQASGDGPRRGTRVESRSTLSTTLQACGHCAAVISICNGYTLYGCAGGSCACGHRLIVCYTATPSGGDNGGLHTVILLAVSTFFVLRGCL